jgi:putative transposase
MEPKQSDLPDRKHPAHGVFDCPDKPTIVYVTLCTKDRDPWLATNTVHLQLREVWQGADAWLIGRYMIMPDHIHFFASPNGREISLDAWIQYWKSQFSKQHRNEEHRWQTDHWDRRLRSHESYDEKWRYVEQNPVRHGLVSDPKDWPYQGGLNELRWF